MDDGADLLASLGALLGGKHGGVGRGLVPVGLDLHTTSDSRDRLLSGQISHVDKGVVETKVNKEQAGRRSARGSQV